MSKNELPVNPIDLFGQEPPERIIILRALQLGDMLCAVPALRALRRAFPEAGITLVGLPWARSFVERFGKYLDDFIEFPGYPGLPEREADIRQFPKFINEVQGRHFDLALQMQGSGIISNHLLMLFGARQNAGFCVRSGYCPPDAGFMVYPDDEPEIRRNLRLMQHLGIPFAGEDLEFPLSPEDWKEFQALGCNHDLKGQEYAVIHAGASKADRRWSVERFASVGDGLAERGYKVVLTGTPAEAVLTAALADRLRSPAVDLAGATSLGSLAALLCEARLVVCNDTGVAHLAEALNVPSVVLFSANDADRWAPFDRDQHRVVTRAAQTSPEVVLGEVDELLGKERLYAGL